MPLELAELREKAVLSDPSMVASEAKRVETLAKKHKVSAEALKTGEYTTEFKRSGYSYSKRLHSLVVGNNAIRMMTFKPPVKNLKSKKELNTQSAHNFFATEIVRPQTTCSLSKSETKKSYLQAPSECPQAMRAITRILHPFIPEEYFNENGQSVTSYMNIGTIC